MRYEVTFSRSLKNVISCVISSFGPAIFVEAMFSKEIVLSFSESCIVHDQEFTPEKPFALPSPIVIVGGFSPAAVTTAFPVFKNRVVQLVLLSVTLLNTALNEPPSFFPPVRTSVFSFDTAAFSAPERIS